MAVSMGRKAVRRQALADRPHEDVKRRNSAAPPARRRWSAGMRAWNARYRISASADLPPHRGSTQ